MLRDFDERQLRWENYQLPDISDPPMNNLRQASLNREGCGLRFLPTRVVAVSAFVGLKVYTAHSAAQLPGQPSIASMTAGLPSLLTAIYAEQDVFPTPNLLDISLLQNPGQN